MDIAETRPQCLIGTQQVIDIFEKYKDNVEKLFVYLRKCDD